MRKRKQLPIALTIAGSDSGGGAGIQADLKTFAVLGVHGTSVITSITAQNPTGVLGIEPCSSGIVRKQLEAVFSELPPRAMKTGMLYSAPIIHVVAEWAAAHRDCALVLDPVMVATSGAMLLQPSAVRALTTALMPLATLVTPNVPEAEALLAKRIQTPEDMRGAAREIHKRFRCAVLLKGGHLETGTEAIDLLFDGMEEWLLSSRRTPGVNTHGTGCTYSAAIAAHLARGASLVEAVGSAKEFISTAIATSYRAHGHDVLNVNGL